MFKSSVRLRSCSAAALIGFGRTGEQFCVQSHERSHVSATSRILNNLITQVNGSSSINNAASSAIYFLLSFRMPSSSSPALKLAMLEQERSETPFFELRTEMAELAYINTIHPRGC